MGTKNNPAPNDCYAKALPDEPMFVLLARDPDFARMVHLWANQREDMINAPAVGSHVGRDMSADRAMIQEARDCATAGEKWRRENFGSWRAPETTPETEDRPCSTLP